MNILNETQFDTANKWLGDHRDHVNNLIEGLEVGYAPSLEEDKNDPRLWKPTHWFWFIYNYFG